VTPPAPRTDALALLRACTGAVIALCVLVAVLAGCPGRDRSEPGASSSCLRNGDTLFCGVVEASVCVRSALGDSEVASDGAFCAWLDSVARRIGPTLRGVDGAQMVESLKTLVYRDLGMTFDANQDDVRGMFPQTAVSRRTGSCLGVSLLFLTLAERLRLPVYGVHIPGHFFVRFDNGAFRVNIEPNKGGFPRTDAYYRERYSVTDSSGYDMRNLGKPEVLAVLWYNAGNALRSAGRIGDAVAAYRRSVAGWSRLAEAWGNLGIALDALGQGDSAIACLVAAQKVNPRLAGLSRNLGTLLLTAGRAQDAAAEFRRGLERAPDDADLRYGLGISLLSMGDTLGAVAGLCGALALRPGWKDAEAALAKAGGL